jgi:hypothetical protein
MNATRPKVIDSKALKMAVVLMLTVATGAWGRQELSSLGNGVIVVASTWPSLVIVSPVSTLGKCSGALIGPNVVVTAAHCVGQGDNITVNHVTAHCDLPPNSGVCPQGLDLALCMLTGSIANVSRFERPSLDQSLARVGQPVTLSGFGDPHLANLQIGKATVMAPDTATGCLVVGGMANGCPGDSGGAVFANDRGRDVLIGVISRGGAIPGNRARTFKGGANAKSVAALNSPTAVGQQCPSGQPTGIVDLTSPPAANFIDAFRRAHSAARICGRDTLPPGTCF